MKKYIAGIIFALGIGYLLFTNHDNITGYTSKLEKVPAVESSKEDSLEAKINKTIKIATFNIQVFGRSKRKKQDVMNILTKTVRNFDITAVQEIRDSSETTLDYFVREINELQGADYKAVGSERLGRTSSKERYAFIYNPAAVSFSGISYTYNDENDVFEREPFIAGFSSGNFDYVLVNVHIKPDDAKREIAALADVVKDADEKFANDHDIIVLGDFNADGSYFSENITTGFRDLFYTWIVSDDMDTTVAKNTYTYDRIVFQQEFTTQDFTGNTEVFRFDQIYHLTPELTKKVSDHYPVFAVFYTDKDTD